MTPKEFMKIEDEQNAIIEAAEKVISAAHDEALKCPAPKNRRPAKPADIVVGAVIWNNNDESDYWLIVCEVLNPQSDFKAFVDHVGDRHGLHRAFVEVET